ncbi:MAG: arginine repressor [Bacteroidota bacterium]|jgi:transcriptional regulator of arginine metabolism
MMTKNARQFAIKEIISDKTVSNQDELRLELKKEGFTVTQATLSRDLRELGIGRAMSEEGMRYTIQSASEAQILRPLVGAEVISIHANESVIVVRTLPGCANTVGEFLDTQKNSDIIGTLAGDNTLLVIPQSQKKTKQLLTFLKDKLIEGK